MKRRALTHLLAVVFALALMLAVIGCGGDSPTATVEKFLKASQDKDCETMVDLFDFSLLEAQGQTVDREQFVNDCKNDPTTLEIVDFKVTGEKVEGDNATVDVDVTSKEDETESKETVPFKVKKVDGEWKVSS